jgi:hypothetical protein
MRTASEFVPGATSGNATSTVVAAPPSVVWQALDEIGLDELRVTQLLMGIRSLPARVLHRGSLRRGRRRATAALVEAMTAGRFVELHREPEAIITLGLVGQFWRLDGGDDADIETAAEFVAFDRPGFVKAAIDFQLERCDRGTRVITHTCNRATDRPTAQRFRWYWLLIGPGSKAIRLDILHAVRRRAERLHRATGAQPSTR